jgi:two-component sensor histidine kinase
MVIPADRHDEERLILERIRSGQRVDHYETIRKRKDGSLVEISLTVSPIKDMKGRIIGASKIARDVTERRRAEERQQLLLREMDHRVRNLFALAAGVVSLSARTTTTPDELASDIRKRLLALARAQALTLPKGSGVARCEQSVSLHTLIRTITAPFNGELESGLMRIVVSGVDIALANGSVTSFALLLHEFATNAAKYGALATSAGRISIECAEVGGQFVLTWAEQGGPPIEHKASSKGFGSFLAEATIEGQLGGSIAREWKRDGLIIRLTVPRHHIVS